MKLAMRQLYRVDYSSASVSNALVEVSKDHTCRIRSLKAFSCSLILVIWVWKLINLSGDGDLIVSGLKSLKISSLRTAVGTYFPGD
jgi:hypothetical protein